MLDAKNEKVLMIGAGAVIGCIAAVLVLFGNPANMGFCIACFIRDSAGALGFHSAAAVQYLRPEIIGIILGSFLLSVFRGEFRPRGGSAPMTRFLLGFAVMIGCLMFLGCPFRMILRLAGGDLNALPALIGFVGGILLGVVFLNRGYSLKRTYSQKKPEGKMISVIAVFLLAILLFFPSLLKFSEEGAGPGAKHAAIVLSLAAGLAVGALAQRTRLCMAGGFRDAFLFKEFTLLSGFGAIFVTALVVNLILTGITPGTYFKLGMTEQPVAHTNMIWNCLGMVLAGFGSVLLGGCPLRQLVMAGEGNTDSAVTVLGYFMGAAFAHNFGLASSAKGPTSAGMIAVIIGLLVVVCIAWLNLKGNEKA